MTKHFLFSTGIENSCPTIQNGRKRVDQMAASKHYAYWREDFELVDELGVRALRYGPPLYNTYLGPNRFDWEFPDMTFGDLGTRQVIPIADLCHFGVPDWIENFQNPDFPELFANYARAFAERYSWVQLYTPINEMFICATFSASYGWWNEQLRSERAFVTALRNIVKANVLAMHAILSVRPDAIFVQSESSEYFHPDNPRALNCADHWNERRFLSLDLNYGRQVNSEMYQFLLDNGLSRADYDFFMSMSLMDHCIMGNDYYLTNEHNVTAEGVTGCSGEIFGYHAITRQYYQRYLVPIMHTETNANEGPRGDEAVSWLRKQWANVLCVRNSGIPTIGFTWYSLIDQVDWDSALREDNGNVNPLGLYDLDRKPRAVGKAYKQLIDDWQEVLPAQSVCLTVPLAPRWCFSREQAESGRPARAV